MILPQSPLEQLSGNEIVLSHYKKRIRNEYIYHGQSIPYNPYNAYFKDGSLTNELKTYANDSWGDGSNPYSLSLVLDGENRPSTFFKTYHLSGGVEYSTSGCTGEVLRGYLKNKNIPVIVTDNFSFLNISGIGSHAVVAYGYDANGNIKIHLGLPSLPTTTISQSQYGTFDGGYLYIENPGSTFTNSSESMAVWQRKAAQFVLTYDYMSYAYNGLFRPNDNAIRGVFVNSIHALAGYPEATNQAKINEFHTNFPDMTESSPYYDAALWAYSKEILKGMESPNGVVYLGLNEPLTREQAVTFFYRLKSPMSGISFTMRVSQTGPSYTSFLDYASVGEFAQIPMNWATTHYIIEGAGNYLYPQNNLTRAELAKMILNYCNRVRKN